MFIPLRSCILASVLGVDRIVVWVQDRPAVVLEIVEVVGSRELDFLEALGARLRSGAKGGVVVFRARPEVEEIAEGRVLTGRAGLLLGVMVVREQRTGSAARVWTVRAVIGADPQAEVVFDEREDTAKVVLIGSGVLGTALARTDTVHALGASPGDVAVGGVARHYQERHTKAVGVAASPVS